MKKEKAGMRPAKKRNTRRKDNHFSEGYISLHRKILNSEVWELTGNQFKVFTYLLLKANYKPYATLKRGQLYTTRKDIEHETRVSKNDVQEALKKLEKLNIITVQGVHSKGSTITILNYSEYQNSYTKYPKNRNGSANLCRNIENTGNIDSKRNTANLKTLKKQRIFRKFCKLPFQFLQSFKQRQSLMNTKFQVSVPANISANQTTQKTGEKVKKFCKASKHTLLYTNKDINKERDNNNNIDNIVSLSVLNSNKIHNWSLYKNIPEHTNLTDIEAKKRIDDMFEEMKKADVRINKLSLKYNMPVNEVISELKKFLNYRFMTDDCKHKIYAYWNFFDKIHLKQLHSDKLKYEIKTPEK